LLLALASFACSSLYAAPDRLDGRHLGEFKLTFYRLAVASRAQAGQEPGLLPVQSRGCARVLAWVPEAFHSDLGLQGSGILPYGRLLNFEERCSCAVPTRRGDRICYAELKRTDFPFGRGAEFKRQPYWLQPFRSAAVDRAMVPIGSVLYIPALRERGLPHGAVHNGCVRAEDTGRAIQGLHLDLFAGETSSASVSVPPEVIQTLPAKPVPVFADSKRCTGAFP
jgi:3D (Asp-Asp-Asp) domain-containing protein